MSKKPIKTPLSIFTIAIHGIGFCFLSSCIPSSNPADYPVKPPLELPAPDKPDSADNEPDEPEISDDDTTTPDPEPEPVRAKIPTAKRVPGRPNHVFNPFTQNMVNVEGIPSGMKVRDPQDPNEANKFYVP